MYLTVIDGYIYGQPMSLTAAMAKLYSCGNTSIYRASDRTIAVRRAGSSTEITHVRRDGTERRITRRLTWPAKRAWLAEMHALNAQRRVAKIAL